MLLYRKREGHTKKKLKFAKILLTTEIPSTIVTPMEESFLPNVRDETMNIQIGDTLHNPQTNETGMVVAIAGDSVTVRVTTGRVVWNAAECERIADDDEYDDE